MQHATQCTARNAMYNATYNVEHNTTRDATCNTACSENSHERMASLGTQRKLASSAKFISDRIRRRSSERRCASPGCLSNVRNRSTTWADVHAFTVCKKKTRRESLKFLKYRSQMRALHGQPRATCAALAVRYRGNGETYPALRSSLIARSARRSCRCCR